MKSLITVVTGTINRLPLLKNMVASARREARGLPITFIIVDSNSTDGTEEWCNTQADILHIPFGKPSGAIRAFTHGGMLSKTRYTILANDDIEFRPYSILSAFRHIEDDPRIGAIAFADNRNSADYRVQRHGARSADGIQVGSVYAQVGMYRTELMQSAGVWGADDPAFGGSGAWTYGGDNYLSSKLWEYGYLIKPAPLAEITDLKHDDQTREIGYSKGATDARLYHQRFGNGQGAIFGSNRHEAPAIDTNPLTRVLHMPIVESMNTPQQKQMVGLTEAFSEEAVIRYEYTLRAFHVGKIGMEIELYNIVNIFKPHVILMQAHDTRLISAELVKRLKEASLDKHNKSAYILNWNGDYWRERLFEPSMLNMLKECDCQLVVDNAVIPMYADKGIKAHYWQVAPETPVITEELLAQTPSYDVLFMGAIYSQARRDLVEFLHRLRSTGLNVGLYGMNYPKHIPTNGQTYYDFAQSQALMAKAGVVIGAMEFADSDGYVSNRLFECLQAGGVLLQQRVINADVHLGLVGGVHCAWWDSIADLEELITYYLQNRDVAKAMAKRGQAFVRECHSHDIRIEQLFQIIEELQS